jgi:hypothetical protein
MLNLSSIKIHLENLIKRIIFGEKTLIGVSCM